MDELVVFDHLVGRTRSKRRHAWYPLRMHDHIDPIGWTATSVSVSCDLDTSFRFLLFLVNPPFHGHDLVARRAVSSRVPHREQPYDRGHAADQHQRSDLHHFGGSAVRHRVGGRHQRRRVSTLHRSHLTRYLTRGIEGRTSSVRLRLTCFNVSWPAYLGTGKRKKERWPLDGCSAMPCGCNAADAPFESEGGRPMVFMESKWDGGSAWWRTEKRSGCMGRIVGRIRAKVGAQCASCQVRGGHHATPLFPLWQTRRPFLFTSHSGASATHRRGHCTGHMW